MSSTSTKAAPSAPNSRQDSDAPLQETSLQSDEAARFVPAQKRAPIDDPVAADESRPNEAAPTNPFREQLGGTRDYIGSESSAIVDGVSAPLGSADISAGAPIKTQAAGDTQFGAVLGAARARLGHDLDDVSAQINIKPSLLGALEREDWDLLPTPPYTIGFVRTYAQLLGLEPEEMARLYKEAYGRAKGEVRLGPTLQLSNAGANAPSLEGRFGFNIVPIIGVLSVAVFGWAVVAQVAERRAAMPSGTDDAPSVVLNDDPAAIAGVRPQLQIMRQAADTPATSQPTKSVAEMAPLAATSDAALNVPAVEALPAAGAQVVEQISAPREGAALATLNPNDNEDETASETIAAVPITPALKPRNIIAPAQTAPLASSSADEANLAADASEETSVSEAGAPDDIAETVVDVAIAASPPADQLDPAPALIQEDGQESQQEPLQESGQAPEQDDTDTATAEDLANVGEPATALSLTSDAVLLSSASAPFPHSCAGTGLSAAQVLVRLDVDVDGAVRNPQIISSPDTCFHAPALAQIAQWRFSPRKIEGAAAFSFDKRVTVQFTQP